MNTEYPDKTWHSLSRVALGAFGPTYSRRPILPADSGLGGHGFS